MAITAIRTVIIYLVLIVAMRVMGKRQLSDLQPIELVVTLLMADMASVPMQESGMPLLGGLIPIAVLVSLELLLSGAMLKLPAVATLISGKPVVIIRDGVLQQKSLKKLRMTIADLSEYMRRKNIFDIKQVQYAIAETDGQISLFLYADSQPATAADAGKSPPDDGMPIVILSDGRLCDWAMRLCGVDEQWVRSTLRLENCALSEVFLMTADKAKNYYLVRKEESA